MKKIIIVFAMFALLALFARGEGQFQSLADVGPDGFPKQFSISYAALQSYYLEQVAHGFLTVYGPAVLTVDKPYGKTFEEFSGKNGGEEILGRLGAFFFFRIANPQENGAFAYASLDDGKGQAIFTGSTFMRPVKDDGGWKLLPPKIELWFVSNPPSLPIPAVDAIHIVAHNDKGDIISDRYVDRDEQGFKFDLNSLPAKGEVILIKYGEKRPIMKSYDIPSGMPSETLDANGVSFLSNTIHGVFSYYGVFPQISGDKPLEIPASVRQGEYHSPLVSLRLMNERDVKIWAVVVDQNGVAVVGATAFKYRVAGSLEWSEPVTMSPDGTYTLTLGPGKYYFIFDWPEGTFPESVPTVPSPSPSGGASGGGEKG